jgi:hypothetical protein
MTDPAPIIATPKPREIPSDLAAVVPPTTPNPAPTTTTANPAETSAAATGDANPTPFNAPVPTVASRPVSILPSALESYVKLNQVSFVGVVLGPINTAILNTRDGTIVVAVGDSIPKSDVVVKTVTADQVVLLLGQDTLAITKEKEQR